MISRRSFPILPQTEMVNNVKINPDVRGAEGEIDEAEASGSSEAVSRESSDCRPMGRRMMADQHGLGFLRILQLT